jgi:hypothetical protein
MPLPALAAATALLAKQGAKAVAKKYGPEALKQLEAYAAKTKSADTLKSIKNNGQLAAKAEKDAASRAALEARAAAEKAVNAQTMSKAKYAAAGAGAGAAAGALATKQRAQEPKEGGAKKMMGGGMTKAYKEGGKVRGYGMARGSKSCKMR